MDFIARYRENENIAQPLEEHLKETASLSACFSMPFSFPDLLRLASFLHDAGKASASWQEYLQKSIEGKTLSKKDHATVGAQILKKLLPNKLISATALESIIMYHHGSGLPDMISQDGSSEFLSRLSKDETEVAEIEKNISFLCGEDLKDILQSEIVKTDGRNELLELCKKGATSKKQLLFNMGLHLRNLSSCLIDADRTNSAAFEKMKKINIEDYEKIPDWSVLLKKLEMHLSEIQSDNTLGKIRSYVSDRCVRYGQREKGIYTCSAFTGAGKTLASLRFALEQAKKYNMNHIFIIAPYTSILDQNAEQIRIILEDEKSNGNIVLECHSNISAEKKAILKGSEENYSRFEETWQSPVIITTMVQFLETLFGSGTKKIRRMHQMANSVLLFDEVQTLPVKTTFLFNWGLEYLVNVCGCSALLCTATQPCLDKIGTEEMYYLKTNGEVIEKLTEHFDSLKRVDFLDMTNGGLKKHSAAEICNYIQAQMNKVNSFLAVVNTKPQAKELFELIKERACADYVYHLSTNMCPAHRKNVISEIKKKLDFGEKIICVSTRLIEAGVDVSFEGALRYMAGLDSIIQTAGRCNRNNELSDSYGNKIKGKVAIFTCEDEKLGSLDELKIAQEQMERVLRDFPADEKTKIINLIQPTVIDRYFNYFYASIPESLLKYAIKENSATVLDMLSDNEIAKKEYERNHNGEKWKLPYMQSFKTAWENFEVIADTTTGVIVPYENDVAGRFSALERGEENYGEKLRVLKRDAQQYSVNVYSNQFIRMLKENMIYEVLPDSDIYALYKDFYDKDRGLVYEITDSFADMQSVF